MIDVILNIHKTMKREQFSETNLLNSSARIVLGELSTKQKDIIGTLTSEHQFKILNKMKNDREKTAQIYLTNNRQDLADKELTELRVISTLLDELAKDMPKLFTEDQTIELIKKFKIDYPNSKIGDFMKYITTNQLNVDKKMAAKIFNCK